MTAVADRASGGAGRESRPIVASLRYAIGVVVLALGMRTWLALGWIEPVYVSGRSMVPAYRPAHRMAACPHCLGVVRLATEWADDRGTANCPWCTQGKLAVGAAELRGDRLWIDRTAYLRSGPTRWQTAALVCPDTGRLCIKRVLGLPGETVALADGNLWIDDRLCQKTLAEQREMRVPLHRETSATRRWTPEAGSGWQFRDDHWHSAGRWPGWLVYQQAGPITDAVWFDLGRSRRLFVQGDVMFSGRIAAERNVTLEIKVASRSGGVLVSLADEQATLWELDAQGRRVERLATRQRTAEERRAEGWLCEVSTFDGQVLAAVDGQTLLRAALPDALAEARAGWTFAIRAEGGVATLHEATLWRDVYHGPPPPGVDWAGGAPRWQLGPNEYFVAGDNGAASLDSRVWGPIPKRLLVGAPRRLGSRAIAFPPAGGRPL